MVSHGARGVVSLELGRMCCPAIATPVLGVKERLLDVVDCEVKWRCWLGGDERYEDLILRVWRERCWLFPIGRDELLS